MQYTTFGKTGIEVSRLGFGAMRFPTIEVGGKSVYDEDESVRMLERALELGVNYYDTAPYYCDGVSENIVGKFLKGRRSDVYVSTKYPKDDASLETLEKNLASSLKKLDTDYIDFYHLWGIALPSFEKIVEAGVWARLLKLREEGVVRNISFSFHSENPEELLEIIRRGEGQFASVLCQYNLLDRSNEAGIAFAHEQGVGVVIMGPVGGGRLGSPSPVIQELLPEKAQSSAETAMRFVLNNPGVSIALSGMASMAMVEENAAVGDNASPLSAEESARIDAMLKENERLAGLYCTGCKYCMPCPAGLDIPKIFDMMNLHRVYQVTDYARERYALIGKDPFMQFENASACTQCGACEAKCPQRLQIREQLAETHTALG